MERCEGRSDASPRTGAPVLALVAVVLVALSLRGPVSAVGPLLLDLRRDEGLSAGAVALLPTLPIVCFGLLAPVAPALASRLGLHRAVLAGSGLLLLGVLLRGAGVVGLFAGTVLLGAGIAVVNVLLPAVVKADLPDRLPLATGLVTASLALSASLGAGLAEPLRAATGGPVASLGLWLVPVAVGLLAWLPLARARERGARVPGAGRVLPLLRDRTAAAVTAYFGLQSLAFFTMLAWLSAVLRDAGVPAAQAGAMLAVAALLGVPVGFVVPRRASAPGAQSRWVVLVAVPYAAGLVGLLVAPGSAPWLWSVLLGAGAGAAFPLALTIVLLRSRDGAQAARLSACAQGVGYTLCACGPVAVGLLREAAGSWRPCLVLLLGLLVVQVAVGVAAGRERVVTG